MNTSSPLYNFDTKVHIFQKENHRGTTARLVGRTATILDVLFIQVTKYAHQWLAYLKPTQSINISKVHPSMKSILILKIRIFLLDDHRDKLLGW
jgi:hypothetical protein